MGAKKPTMPHYKLISLPVSADGVRMINSGYDNTMAIVLNVTMHRQTKNTRTSGKNKSKSHLVQKPVRRVFVDRFDASTIHLLITALNGDGFYRLPFSCLEILEEIHIKLKKINNKSAHTFISFYIL